MTLDVIKEMIEQRTGVPASLLTGETAEENIAQAKALLAYKKEGEVQRPKSTREQFADWLDARDGTERQDTAGAALAEIEEKAREEAGGYPRIQDGGEIDTSNFPDGRSASEQFAEWLDKKTSFSPFKDSEGWEPLLH